jgi:hypothetical protein
MARLKSVRGNVNGNRREHASTPTVSMPQVPEFGQSYSQPQIPPPQHPGYPTHGHPYGTPTQFPPQPARPNYGSPGPQGGAGFHIAPADRPPPGASPVPPGPPGWGGPGQRPPNQPMGNTPPHMGSPQPGYAAQFPSAQSPRPPQGPPQGPPHGRVPSGPQTGRPPQGPPRPSPSPLPDIGFTAPPDFSGADRQRMPGGRLMKPAAGRGGPVGGPPGGPAPPTRLGTNQPPTSSPHPPRQQPMNKPQPAAAPTPPTNTGPSKPPTSGAAAAPHKKPGKGPATFEEMGVPATKKQDDCVSCSSRIMAELTVPGHHVVTNDRYALGIAWQLIHRGA